MRYISILNTGMRLLIGILAAMILLLDWAALHDIFKGEKNPYSELFVVFVSAVFFIMIILINQIRKNSYVKLVVYVPVKYADKVRLALGKAGAGLVGDYSSCSFSMHGTARYLPLQTAHPTIGKIGKPEKVIEERIETVCLRKDLPRSIDAVKKVHPYEEVAFDVYSINDPNEITHNPYIKINSNS